MTDTLTPTIVPHEEVRRARWRARAKLRQLQALRRVPIFNWVERVDELGAPILAANSPSVCEND